MAEQMFPIWDSTGVRILSNPDGTDMMLTESQVRRDISRQQLGVLRGRGATDRKIVSKNPEHEKVPIGMRRIENAQPYCVEVSVGDTHKAYMHVAERCAAHYDGRNLCIGSDGNGNKIFANQKINRHCL
jgi:hypothetical protein